MKWLAPALAYLAVGLGMFVFQSAWGALVGFHLAILGSLWIARPAIPAATLFQNTTIKWSMLSLLLCGSSGVTVYFLWDAFDFANDLPQQIRALGLTIQTWPPFIAYFALVNPFVEEYFWRGYLGSKSAALHMSDFLYAGFHSLILLNKVSTGAILFALSMLVLAGWFWRQLLRKDHGLLAPVLGHMAADLTILLAVFFKTALY
jgi:membrane protease YdiL (CAAX protease family)